MRHIYKVDGIIVGDAKKVCKEVGGNPHSFTQTMSRQKDKAQKKYLGHIIEKAYTVKSLDSYSVGTNLDTNNPTFLTNITRDTICSMFNISLSSFYTHLNNKTPIIRYSIETNKLEKYYILKEGTQQLWIPRD